MISVALMLIGVAVAGHFGVFGKFGGTYAADPPPFTLLSLLAFAMGLQNASVSSTTGLTVRTTHLTGPSTDLGVHLGVACLTTGAERRAALRGAALRGGKIFAFVLGAGIARAAWPGCSDSSPCSPRPSSFSSRPCSASSRNGARATSRSRPEASPHGRLASRPNR